MSNILDDILSNMDKPPTKTPDQRRRIKQASENIKHVKQREKEALHSFKKQVQELIGMFISDTKLEYFEFEPLDRPFRTIIYDVAEVAGVIACSYGEDEIDRYTVIYRKDSGPTEDERTVRNNGGKWNAVVCAEMKKKREVAMQQPAEPQKMVTRKGKSIPLTGPDYRVKYSHISITPQKTSTNCNYGEVPSSLKRDVRSIEQTLSDLKAKRLKTSSSNPKDSDISTPGTSSSCNFIVPEAATSLPLSVLKRLGTAPTNEHLAVAGTSRQQQVEAPASPINEEEEEHDEHLKDFIENVIERLDGFASKRVNGIVSLEFPPQTSPRRNEMIFRLAKIRNLYPKMYGVSYVDQYVMIYRKDNHPGWLEKSIRWNGGVWNQDVKRVEKLRYKRLGVPLSDKTPVYMVKFHVA